MMERTPRFVGDVLGWILQTIEVMDQSAEQVNADFDGKLSGRLRTDRTTPTGNADVAAGDAEGDVIRTGGYTYTLVSDGGTLKWDRQAWDVAW